MEKRILDLTGYWQFKEYPESARRMRDLDVGSTDSPQESNWLECRVPSSIYTCLTQAGVIKPSELYCNPEDFLWPGEKPWIFQKFFDLPQDFFKLDRAELVFEGLDTFCQVWLNDKLVGRSDNMFCSYRFDVKELLKEKNNRLLVKCDSAIKEGNRLMNRFGMLGRDDCSLPFRSYVRKAQCQFGWDFAPPLPGCGIWKSVYIEGFSAAALRDVHIRTIEADPGVADIRISVEIENFRENPIAKCHLTVYDPAGNIAAEAEFDFGSRNNVSTVLKIKPVSLWQPNLYGSQPLYELKTELFSDNKPIESSSKKFGIRIVHLNQSAEKNESCFEFIVNNIPVYVRGASWVPLSLFVGSAADSDYERMLTAVKDANINMLRVWGGGIYETETFYNICDRLGIMVWQDFPFACAYYPDRPWFDQMVRTEAAQNIIRLRNHPSLVLWCGNNEIDWQHATNGISRGRKFYGRDIYHKLLPQLLHELDPDRDYIPSTPFGSAKYPNEPSTGTVHQWNVWAGLEPTDNYLVDEKQIPRFAAEFGLQSLPDKKTLQNFTSDKDLHPASEQLEKHNYQPNGQGRLQYYINELFGPPKNIDELIYLSQLTQARAVRKNAEHLRRNCDINKGLLFWQLNDCIPAISWSCIDCLGRFKALYYYIKRAFAPVLITISAKYVSDLILNRKSITSLTASIINHSAKPLTGLFNCSLNNLNFKSVDNFQRPVSIGPYDRASFPLPSSFIEPKEPESCFLYLSLEIDKSKTANNSFFYLPDKYINWPGQKIEIQSKQFDDYNWQLKLMPSSVIKDLFIDMPFEAELSDNFFDLFENKSKTVNIHTKEKIEDLPKKIILYSVNSILSAG
ncbi:MAG: glycoside hydrolase family 2 protein [Sedimentisphaerales bacterium]|nr:glycoside hydrolase family 2 protein [Sedimentisphaerales bacterium]